MKKPKTICIFGNFDPGYSRNAVLLQGLKENGINIVECRTTAKGWRRYWELYIQHKAMKESYDFLLVAFPGQINVFLAKLFCKKPIKCVAPLY